MHRRDSDIARDRETPETLPQLRRQTKCRQNRLGCDRRTNCRNSFKTQEIKNKRGRKKVLKLAGSNRMGGDRFWEGKKKRKSDKNMIRILDVQMVCSKD